METKTEKTSMDSHFEKLEAVDFWHFCFLKKDVNDDLIIKIATELFLSPTLVLESYCPACFRGFPLPAHLILMNGSLAGCCRA